MPEHIIWADKPANSWMTEAYPLGNGRMGAMVFGRVGEERIQFNELSLWTGDENETGSYQPFGDLFVNFGGDSTSQITNYRRELDIAKALQTVSYSQNGINFKREYFCSFPAKVMVMRFTADKKVGYAVKIKLKDAHGQAISSGGAVGLQFGGKLENGLAYFAAARVTTTSGKIAVSDDGKGNKQLEITGSDCFTITLSAATNYDNNRSKHWRGEDAEKKVSRALDAAGQKTYDALLAGHLHDYKKLFDRVSLTLGNAHLSPLTTLARIANYRQKPDNGLEALLYQYGRYLLISSSRKGGLPANLQGIWNDSTNPPWRSDYHSNINIQMNYWPAEPTNLAECHFPYLDYIQSMREVKKESTRKEYGDVRGWTVKTENNIFGGSSFIWNTPGSAWYAQALWEHYAFTRDTAYLKNFAYPILKEIVEFWDDRLKRRPDGTLVAPMGWSPEHGPTEDGVTYDQAIIDDLFGNYLEATGILNIDKEYSKHVADMKAHLLQPKIGRWGQLQEWETDRDDPNDTHRHSSNLFGLHPGKSISLIKTPQLAQAAKVSLQARGDASTGWSMAWKMNFWARLGEGNHAYHILNNFITLAGASAIDYNQGGGVYQNLLCAHPPFQIDGNLGYTAGVTEMLLQSQTDEIQLLPALPAAWAKGKVKGLVARGNFELLNMDWEKGKVRKVSIVSRSGGVCKLRAATALKCPGTKLQCTKDGNGMLYTFQTQAGKTYQFTAE